MNKSVWLIVVIGIVLLLGGVYIVTTRDSSNNGQTEVSNTIESGTDTSTQSGLSYVKTSEQELSNIASDKRVIFFHASWCSTCKGLDKDIMSNMSKIPAGITIARVDFDEETNLKKKYGVTIQHTLVQIDSDGNEVAKWNGSKNLESLLAKLE